MRIACVYWYTSSVGGIATHLNSLRKAAISAGDTFDILHSKNWRTKSPSLFKERQWIRGGDTRIWVDGEVPQTTVGARWLNNNYDAVLYGFICPHKTKAYPTPDFLPLYDQCRLPKLAWVMDGYWDDYADWATPLLPKLKGVLCPLESYATPLRKLNANVVISAFPFVPSVGAGPKRSERPLLVWPCQFKNIKGITQFLGVVPDLTSIVDVELYSDGIRYYQLRTEVVWKKAVGKDHFKGYNGVGKATYFGNVDLPVITEAYRRAWFTVNLQGMTTRKETYRRGSYNNTEVEALFYGACPILHSSTLQTDLPQDTYISVDNAEEIPGKVKEAIQSGFGLCPKRREKARDFVMEKHLASNRYQDLRRLLD